MCRRVPRYAHTLIAMSRSVGIPARIVSAYAPNVVPQYFHAVVDVFLDGNWHLIDPTGMAQIREIVRIGVGRDAADISFMSSYGWMELKKTDGSGFSHPIDCPIQNIAV